jgi:hypothetical protein
VRRSRDRGYEANATAIAFVVVDHRILRRVPIDGRHPGPKEASTLYGAAWRAVSAAPSPKGPARAPKRSRADFSKEDARAKARETEGKRERRQGCQRFDRSGHRGKTTPTPVIEVGDDFATGCSTQWKHRVLCDPPKRSERRETFGPLVMLRGDLRLRGASPRRKSGERAGNARGAGAVSRSSGRSRLDASRVLHVGGSRDLPVEFEER